VSLASNLLYLLAVLAAGVAGRRIGVLTPVRADYLTRFAFYVALPALAFHSLATADLETVLSVEMVVAFAVSVLVVAALAFVVHRGVSTRAERSVAIAQSYHGNLGFLGLPLVSITLGSVAAAKASVLLGVGALVQIPSTVFVLTSLNDADASFADELRGVARNPIVLSLVAGIAASAFGVPIPGVADRALGAVSRLALPAALLSVGASLVLDVDGVEFGTVARVGALKILVMPLVGVVAFTALGNDPLTVRAGTVMLAMPTAVSTFIYANQLGGDAELASTNVFATTVASLGTVFVLLHFLA